MPSHLEAVRSVYDCFARGDVQGVISMLAADVSWTEAAGFPYGGTYSGPDAVLKGVFMRLGAEWDRFSAVPKEFVVQGSTVVALGEYSGTYKETGRSFSAPFVHVWKLEGEKVVGFRQHTDTVLVREAIR